MRFNMLNAKETGYLGYAEGGLNISSLRFYLRAGAFCIDNWDDRIYVYERDAPGNFTVPALYGRGIWTSIYLAYRPVSWFRLYMRASYTDYPFMDQEKRKPGRAELKIQAVLRM